MCSYPRLQHSVAPPFPGSKTKQWPSAVYEDAEVMSPWDLYSVTVPHTHTDPGKSFSKFILWPVHMWHEQWVNLDSIWSLALPGLSLTRGIHSNAQILSLCKPKGEQSEELQILQSSLRRWQFSYETKSILWELIKYVTNPQTKTTASERLDGRSRVSLERLFSSRQQIIKIAFNNVYKIWATWDIKAQVTVCYCGLDEGPATEVTKHREQTEAWFKFKGNIYFIFVTL